jgi:hypothetical protein
MASFLIAYPRFLSRKFPKDCNENLFYKSVLKMECGGAVIMLPYKSHEKSALRKF